MWIGINASHNVHKETALARRRRGVDYGAPSPMDDKIAIQPLPPTRSRPCPKLMTT